MLQKLLARYNHDDFLTTVALFGLIFLAAKQAQIDLDHFGEGVMAIFGGHAARSWGNGKEPTP
jgi:hypothetical protein